MKSINTLILEKVIFTENGGVRWKECDFESLYSNVSRHLQVDIDKAEKLVTRGIHELSIAIYDEWSREMRERSEKRLDGDSLSPIERYYQMHGTKGQF